MKPATTATIGRSLPLSSAPEQRQKALTPPGRGSCCTASQGVLVCTNPLGQKQTLLNETAAGFCPGETQESELTSQPASPG